MNNIDFTKPGGFPFDQSIMGFLQDSISLMQQASAFGGALSILSGCVVASGNATAGYVSINGEILPFIAGAVKTYVIIVEVVTPLTYIDTGLPQNVVKTRTAQFSNTGTMLWANFKRNTTEGVLARLERLERIAAPDLISGGTVRIWMRPAGDIPPDWQPVSSTSPLRGTVLRGLTSGGDYDTLLGVGGSDSKIVTNNNIQQFNIDLPTADGAIPGGSGASFVGLSQTSTSHSRATIGIASPNSLPVDEYTIVDFIEYVGI